MTSQILPKVKRTSFTRLNNTETSEYAHIVLTKTKGNDAYAVIRALVDELDTDVQRLDGLNAERYNAGKNDTQKRIIAREAVVDTLQKIALVLEANANGNAALLVDAGFTCITGKGAHRPVQLEVPVITKLSPTMVPGQVKVHLAECRGARSFAFEFSYDNGTAWHNGSYSSKQRNTFAVKTNQEVMVRVKALGASNTVSEFSAPMTSRVL
jgi:hypothetical protein